MKFVKFIRDAQKRHHENKIFFTELVYVKNNLILILITYISFLKNEKYDSLNCATFILFVLI